jgi:GTP cyclohydrolase I
VKIYNLPDIQQNATNYPKIPIEKVGVRNIKIPFSILKKDGNFYPTTANISSYCSLNEDRKGINMSRIARTICDELEKSKDGLKDLSHFAFKLREAHETDNIYIKAKFDYLTEEFSPITHIKSYEPAIVTFESILYGDKIRNFLTVETTQMSACPCSKEMSLLINNITEDERITLDSLKLYNKELLNKIYSSGFGMHSQKSIIEIKVELENYSEKMWIEELIEISRKNASSSTFSILKRPDEKYVTEVAYMGGYFDENKKFIKVGGGVAFVEDISRNIAVELNKELNKRILDYIVVVNNQESIHSGDMAATSILSAGRELK